MPNLSQRMRPLPGFASSSERLTMAEWEIPFFSLPGSRLEVENKRLLFTAVNEGRTGRVKKAYTLSLKEYPNFI